MSFKKSSVKLNAVKKSGEVIIGDVKLSDCPFIRKEKTSYVIEEDLILPEDVKTYRSADAYMTDNTSGSLNASGLLWTGVFPSSDRGQPEGALTEKDANALKDIDGEGLFKKSGGLTPAGLKRFAPILNKQLSTEQCAADVLRFMKQINSLTASDIDKIVAGFERNPNGKFISKKYSIPAAGQTDYSYFSMIHQIVCNKRSLELYVRSNGELLISIV